MTVNRFCSTGISSQSLLAIAVALRDLRSIKAVSPKISPIFAVCTTNSVDHDIDLTRIHHVHMLGLESPLLKT